MSRRISPVIPGFGLTLGYTLVYLSLIVLIPLAAMFVHAAQLTWDQFWAIITAPRVLAALQLSFGTAFVAAIINGVIGTVLAWVLVRYSFPGRALFDAIVDLPFALPTAVGGIALTAVYSTNGWIGRLVEPRAPVSRTGTCLNSVLRYCLAFSSSPPLALRPYA